MVHHTPHTHTHTYTHTLIQWHTYSHTHSHIHSLTHSHVHSCTGDWQLAREELELANEQMVEMCPAIGKCTRGRGVSRGEGCGLSNEKERGE